MTNPCQITPPFELLQQWRTEYWSNPRGYAGGSTRYLAEKSAQWGYEQRGADNEAELQKARDDQLEACCAWLDAYEAYEGQGAVQMHEDLRPKLKSQAEEAISELDGIMDELHEATDSAFTASTIRAALKRLQELEAPQQQQQQQQENDNG